MFRSLIDWVTRFLTSNPVRGYNPDGAAKNLFTKTHAIPNLFFKTLPAASNPGFPSSANIFFL